MYYLKPQRYQNHIPLRIHLYYICQNQNLLCSILLHFSTMIYICYAHFYFTCMYVCMLMKSPWLYVNYPKVCLRIYFTGFNHNIYHYKLRLYHCQTECDHLVHTCDHGDMITVLTYIHHASIETSICLPQNMPIKIHTLPPKQLSQNFERHITTCSNQTMIITEQQCPLANHLMYLFQYSYNLLIFYYYYTCYDSLFDMTDKKPLGGPLFDPTSIYYRRPMIMAHSP